MEKLNQQCCNSKTAVVVVLLVFSFFTVLACVVKIYFAEWDYKSTTS